MPSLPDHPIPPSDAEPPAAVAVADVQPLASDVSAGMDTPAALNAADHAFTAEQVVEVVANEAASPAANAAPRPADLSPAACADLLKQHFPALFGGQPKPFKLRIQADIQQRAPGVFSKNSLSGFFRRHTGSTGYLIALGKASQRFDLDGQPAGELSEEHRNLAREELARRRQVTRDREQQAHAQQQAAQAEVLQARQARASLLRDFERTTLTPANFCALKGMTADALTPLLEQARREAAEAPPPRPFDDRRDVRRDDRRDDRRDNRPQAPRAGGAPSGRPAGSPAGRPGGRPGGR